MSPKVTVFIAMYNAENYIASTIESVLNQSFTDFEILIINDCSTDLSVKIVEEYRDARIRVLHNEKNEGEKYCRHRALFEAKGELIATLDADDISEKTRLEVQVNEFNKNEKLVLCGSFAKGITETGELNGNLFFGETTNDKIKIAMLFRNQFVNSSTMYKKKNAIEIGGFKGEEFGIDYEFFSKLIKDNDCCNVPLYLILYRQHSNSISVKKKALFTQGEFNILKRSYEKFNLPENLIRVPHGFFKDDFSDIEDRDITAFFNALYNSNKVNGFFKAAIFEKYIFEKWKFIVIKKKSRKLTFDLLKSKFFKYEFLVSRDYRKFFKIIFNPFN